MAKNPFDDTEFGSSNAKPVSADQQKPAQPKKRKNVFDDEDYGKDPGLLRSIGDTGVSTAQGFVRGGKMVSDAFGAGSGVSNALGDTDEWLGGFKSGGRRAEQDARGEKIRQAEESGSTWEEVKAYAGAFADAPIDTTVEALGTMAPAIAANVLTRGRAGNVVAPSIGGVQGAGVIKGEIYDAVKQKHIEAGLTEEQAEAKAREAQAYTGDNTDQIALGAGLGALASSVGVEPAAGRIAARKFAGDAAADTAKGSVLKSAGKGVAAEAPFEAAQGGQERLAANIAEQREGFDTPTWQGVAGSATLEGLAGAAAGGGFGLAEGFQARGQRSNDADPDDSGIDPVDGGPVDPGLSPEQFQAPLDTSAATETAYHPSMAPDQVPSQYRTESVLDQAPTPSQQMGINPNDGPMSHAAALAVDTGASEQAILQKAAEEGSPVDSFLSPGEAVDPTTGEVSYHSPEVAELSQRRMELERGLGIIERQAKEQGWNNRLINQRQRVEQEIEQIAETQFELASTPVEDAGQAEAAQPELPETAAETPVEQAKSEPAAPLTYEKARANADAARERTRKAGAELDKYPTGEMGLTPDAVKATPEWQADKKAFDEAFEEERAANSVVTKNFKKEHSAALKAEREAKAKANREAEAVKPTKATAEDIEHLFGTKKKRDAAIARVDSGKARFGSKKGADKFIRESGIKDTHEVIQTGNRYDVKAKAVEPDYEQRNSQRLSRIDDAKTPAEVDAILQEENSDAERHFAGSERVSIKAGSKSSNLKAALENKQRQARKEKFESDVEKALATGEGKQELIASLEKRLEQFRAQTLNETDSFAEGKRRYESDPTYKEESAILEKLKQSNQPESDAIQDFIDGKRDDAPTVEEVAAEQKQADIKKIVAKTIPEMTDAEIKAAIEHYGTGHKRTKKLQRALEKRGTDKAPAKESQTASKDSLADLVGKAGKIEAQAVTDWIKEHGISDATLQAFLDKSYDQRTVFAIVSNKIFPDMELMDAVDQDRSLVTYYNAKPETVKSLSESAFRSLLDSFQGLNEKTAYYSYLVLRGSDAKSEIDYIGKLGRMANHFRVGSQKHGGKLHRMAEPYFYLATGPKPAPKAAIDPRVAQLNRLKEEMNALADRADKAGDLELAGRLRAQYGTVKPVETDVVFRDLSKNEVDTILRASLPDVTTAERKAEARRTEAKQKPEDNNHENKNLLDAAIDSGKLEVVTVGDKPKKKPSKPKSPKQDTKLDAAASKLSDAKLKAALELKALINSRKGTLNSGVDPELMLAVAKVGALTIADGTVKFAVWVRDVISTTRAVGIDDADVKSFLKEAYGAISTDPGKHGVSEELADQMDLPRDIRRADLDSIIAEQTEDTADGQKDRPAVDESDQQGVQGSDGERGPDSQSGDPQADNSDLEAVESENVGTTDGVRDGKQAGDGPAGKNVDGSGQPNESGLPNDGRKGASGKKQSATGAGKRDSGADGRGAGRARDSDLKSPSAPGPKNFHYDNPLEIVGGGQVARYNKNKAAIERYNDIRDTGRPITAEDQRIIAAYTGWGSFGQDLFQGTWERPMPRDGWQERDQWLRDQLGKEEWEGMQQSIINAHYTDPPTVMAMWEMVRNMGFRGGRVLEPGMGIGNFFGMMPEDLKSRSNLAGIELDPVTGGMAKMLYPDANINIMGYEKSKTPDNFYDLVIGNWPFANVQIPDRRYQKLNPVLHDYFFLKALDQTRPGGLVVGITSHGTMDKKGKVVRNELARKGELIAAYRLPSGAFKEYAGTSVVTDIIILRKRPEPLGMVPVDAGWLESVSYTTPSKETVQLNEYYVNNPDNVIGVVDFGHGTTSGRPGLIVNRPDNVDQRLKEIASNIQKNAYLKDDGAKQISYVTNHLNDREGSLVIDQDGDLGVIRGEYIAKAAEVQKYAVKSEKDTKKREAELGSLIGMRKAYGELIEAERGDGTADAEVKRKELKRQYDTFVKEYGTLNGSFGLKYMRRLDDPFYPALAALERDKDGSYEPADILTKSTTRGSVKIESPSVPEAYIVARNQHVNPSISEIAEIAGKPEDQVRKELIDRGAVFDLPNGDIEASDIYLSGNVRQKMREAVAALESGNKDMERNIAALEKVMPADIPNFNIEAQMGATWVAKEYYEQFAAEMLGLSDTRGIEATYRSGSWRIKFDSAMGFNARPEAKSGYGTERYPFSRLVNAAISNQSVTVKYKDPVTKADVVDRAATEEVNGKIAEMRMKFSEWVWSDAERRDDLEREYNEVRNSYATPTFDGSFMTMEGMALSLGKGPFDLRKHQMDAIWRALVTRKSLNAHEVGTGKTFTMGGIAIESRRYGIAKKPLILAHNANSKTVANEIQQMYPAAKILYIDNLKSSEIATRMRQIANDDWDAIVMPHSLISSVGFREETLMQMAQQDIDELMEEAYEAAKEDGVEIKPEMLDDDKELGKLRSPTAKELVKARNNIVANINKQSQKSSKEGSIPFEELGIDMVLVDEVHEFKKPPIATKMRIKGMNTQSSDRSIALRFMLKYIRGNNNGGNVHTFSGTPITNSMTEAFHQMRYIMEEEMRDAGLDQWDGWFGSFAQEEMDIELTAAGEYESVTRLSKFINTPELRRMIGQYMDVVFSDDMPEMKPRKTKSGKTLSDPTLTELERAQLLNGRTEDAKDRPYKQVINSTSDLTPDQQKHFAKIQQYAQDFRNMSGKERMETMRRGGPESPIVYEGLAAKVSFDARLMNGEALAGMEGKVPDDPNSKASKVINNVMEIYKSHDLATQVIFTQQGLSKTGTRTVTDAAGNKTRRTFKTFSTAHDIVERLVQQGIPREQIAMVTGNTSKDKRAAIAEAMNRAEIRVVIGSTQSLGVGVNMQKNLRAMHHMDAPWMPGDLEQRNGRGQRQGNQWNTVREYRYLTDRIDGRRWQLLVKKQQFIEKFMKSDDSVRIIEADGSMDEDNDILESFAEAAGDARILQLAKIEKDIDMIQRRERLHSQGIANAKRQSRTLGEQISRNSDLVSKFESANAEQRVSDALSSNAGDNFSITLDGKQYSERSKAQEALAAYIAANIRMGSQQRDIGTYGDLTLTIGMSNHAAEPQLYAKFADGVEDLSNKPTVAALEARLRGFNSRVEKIREGIAESESSKGRAEQVAEEPFQQAEQLERLKTKLEEIKEDLENNPVAPPAWLRAGAPTETEVMWNGNKFTVTGHRWNESGWFVLAEDANGTAVIPYMEVTDNQGINLYEEVEFQSPELVQQVDEDGDDNARFKRSPEQQSRGMDVKDARIAVNEMMEGWKGRPAVKVVESLDKLPPKLLKAIQNAGAEGDMRGVFWENQIFVLANRIPNRKALEELILHEAIGHYGLRKMMGRELVPLLNKIYNDLGDSDRAKELKKSYFTDKPFNPRNLNDRLTVAEEMIAHLAESGKHEHRSLFNRLLTAVRAGLRRLGFTIKVSEGDLLALLEGAQRTVQDGGISRQTESLIPRFSRAGNTNGAAFKKWFGDSKVVDANGDPLVVHHGSRVRFTVFDKDKLGSTTGADSAKGGFFFTSEWSLAEMFRRDTEGSNVDLNQLKELLYEADDKVLQRIGEDFGYDLDIDLELEGREYFIGEVLDLYEKDVSLYTAYDDQNGMERVLKNILGKDFFEPGAVLDVYLKIEDPYVFQFDENAEQFDDDSVVNAINEAKKLGKDGVILRDMVDSAKTDDKGDRVVKSDVYIVFEPTQVKSATDNNGDFDGNNPDIRYSRKPSTIPRGFASAAVGKKVTRSIKGKLADIKPTALGALPLMYLRDFAPKTMTALDQYMDQRRLMDADRNEMHSRYDAIAQRWLKERIGSGSLADRAMTMAGLRKMKASGLDALMHDATIMSIDPSKERKPDADKSQYAILRARYEALPAKQKKLFEDVRDAYSDQIKTMEEVIQANIEKSIAFAARRAKREMESEIRQIRDELTGVEQEIAIEKSVKRFEARIKSAEAGKVSRALVLRQKFEQMRVDEPYFPLKRFGDYFVSLRDKNGDLQSFSMFESAADMESAAEQFKKQYPNLDVVVGRKSNKEDFREAIDPTFVSDIQELITEEVGDSALTDAIYQMYLETLPDFSMRKSFIHRNKVEGYNEDAMRAFASSMFHSSHQIARLKYKLEMDELVETAEEQAHEAKDTVDAMTVANELRKRHEWVMNPQGSKMAQRITSAAFIYQLGITPAAAFVNTTQTFILGVPVLGTRFKNEAAATKELLKASKDFAVGKGKIENSLTGNEKKALIEFERMGLIEKTQAHDLAGVGDTGVEYSAVRQKVMSGIAFLFHHAERYNREVTSIAAYRMAVKSGMSHEAAIKEAADLTWTTHFDYSSGNRARFMQNDTAKVLLVFRQYSVNMLSRLAVDTRAMFKGESKEVRREAFRRMAGMYGMFALFAGMMGVPGSQALLMLLEALDWDDEDPWTMEDKIKRSVTEALGEDVAAAFFNGVIGTLSGTDLTNRVGLGHLWFFSPNRELEGRDQYVYWMEQALGAAPSMIANTFSGASMMAEGHVARGLETMMPKAGKDLMRSVRYSKEGVQSLNGYSVVDELSTWGVIAQAMGFTPAHVAEQYDKNSAIKGAEQRILRERRAILNRYALAVRTGDEEMRAKLSSRVSEFNRKNPTVKITNQTIMQSMIRREQARGRAEGGVLIDKRLDHLRREANPS